ncbi:GrpE-domain-containing protein [Aspergillus novoparasiticus]|uniref:GrpE protein homolog n=1 Tax=Aspergillus novoparasiticus TaxID=986946 RepID=A0A5N6EFL0_9EURO|nr:GrpE-domain-containing protein [Aspergillus novoparasiticus]
MFQRTILRQAQAARSLLSVRSTSSAPLALRRTSQFQPQSLRPLAPLPGLRNYSTENKTEENKTEENKQEKNENAESESQNTEDAVRKELEKKEKEVIDLKYVRSVADFLNLQERTKRDMDNARNFAIQRFAVDLLESIDNFDRALLAVPEAKLNSNEPEHKDIRDLVSGLKMTQNILMNALKKHGLERFDPSELAEDGKTQKFDPNMHEATFMAKAEGKENGDIMYTQSKGFKLNGRVLRAAKVGVVKND